MPIARRVLCLLVLLIFAIPLRAQNKPAQCGVTCEPDPTSGSYGSTIKARPATNNSRGRASVLAPTARGDADPGNPDQTLPGSQSYNYVIPILSLPGRNGLDLNLALHYNSQVWTADPAAGTATYNGDRDFPAVGFRLGFGYIEGPFTNALGSQSYLLTEPDGTKRELRFSSGTLYTSFDSSYIDWNSSTKLLRRKNGEQWSYAQVGTSTIFRPTKIQDTNGNYISITYRTDANISNQAIDTITDTLGRAVTFNYDGNLKLTSITAPKYAGGTQSAITFTWGTVALNYNFTLSVADSPANHASVNVITACTYPNGTSYAFTYGDWGIVNKITRKSATGTARNYVRFDYPTAATALSDHPAYQHRYDSKDGVNDTSTWTYGVTQSGSLVSAMAITDPAGTTTTTSLYTTGWQTGMPYSVAIQASGAPSAIRTVWNTWTQDNTSLTYALNPRLSSSSPNLNDSGQASNVSLSYDANGNVTQVLENDYGGLLLRKTQTDYQTASAYLNQHILDRPTQVRICCDGSGNLVSRTDFAYVNTTLTSQTGAAQHDDANYGTGFTTRGNVTSTTRYTNAAGGTGAITRQFTYDTLGNLLTAQVDCCNLEQWTFSSATQYAYPASIIRGPSGGPQFTTTRTYDFNAGLLVTETDPNQKTTTLGYDLMNRLTSVQRADGTTLTTLFDDNAAQPTVTTTTPIDATNSVVQIITADGLGRTIEQETKSGGGTSYSLVDIQYDTLGRVSQASNPHGPSESQVWTVNAYDALNRVATVTPPGAAGSYQYSYSGNATTVTDPAGKERRSYTDALGRLSQVHEPGWGDATPGTGSVTINGTDQSICIEPGPPPTNCSAYQYDTGTFSVTVGSFTATVNFGQFNHPSTTTSIASALASVFNTNSNSPATASVSGSTVNLTAKTTGSSTNYALSTSSTTTDPGDFPNPSFTGQPSGATMTGGTDTATQDNPSLQHPMPTVYSYNPMDELLVSTQGVQQRTFTYDGLGHLLTATTPEAGTVTYAYKDFGAVWTRLDARGVTTTYGYDGISRLNSISYNVGSSGVPATPSVAFAYDAGGSAANALGRMTSMTDGVGSETYQYDVVGRVAQLTKVISGTSYPIQYAYNKASELTSVTYPSGRAVAQSFDPIGRLTQISSGGTNYLSINSTDYNAASEPSKVTYGNTVQGNFSYNARLQLQSLSYTKGATLFSLNYDYTTGVPGNDGQIQRITDNVDGTRTTTYTYDAWLRLKSATNTQWTLTYTYDRYGNRLSQSAPPLNNVTVNPATNHITDTGYSYDAAGNMTNDGLNLLTYDAENRVVTNVQAGATSTYTYDGNRLRVKKLSGGTTTVYIFSGSKVIAEYDNGAAPASPSREYIYSGPQLLATIQGTSTTYHHPDHLSTRVSTDASGNVARTFGHYPFGEVWYETGSASKWKFTSYERDAESLNDYAMARTYVNRLARFSSADPLAGPISDPQSLNRYVYVRNDPINLSDPSGQDWMDDYFSASNHGISNAAMWMLWIEDMETRAFFGELYWELPGRGDPGKEAEAKYNRFVQLAFIKNSLLDLFKKNKECADLLGGEPNARALVGKMSIQDTSAPGWQPPPSISDQELDFIDSFRNSFNFAGTYFGWYDVGRGIRVWNRRAFRTYLNASFWNNFPSGWQTIVIHELAHVARAETSDKNVPSYETIAKVCDTAVP